MQLLLPAVRLGDRRQQPPELRHRRPRGNVNSQGVGIGGGVGQAPEGAGGHVTFYIEVPDVEAALAQAESLGGKRVMGPEQVPGGPELGLLTDPEGHLVGLVKAETMG